MVVNVGGLGGRRHSLQGCRQFILADVLQPHATARDLAHQFFFTEQIGRAAGRGVEGGASRLDRQRGLLLKLAGGGELGALLRLHLGVAVIEPGVIQRRRQTRQLVVIGRGDGDRAAILIYAQKITGTERRDLRPGLRGRIVVTALNGVDHDAALFGQRHGGGVFDVVLVVHVRRRIADQEHRLIGRCLGVPAHARNRILQSLVDRLRTIATPIGLEVHQVCIHGIEVGGQIEHLGDVLIATITIGDQTDADLGRRLRTRHGGGDGPDLVLGRFDEAAHAAGGVEYEDQIDPWPLLRNARWLGWHEHRRLWQQRRVGRVQMGIAGDGGNGDSREAEAE